MNWIGAGNQLTKLLPALGSLAGMGGLSALEKPLRLTKHLRAPLAALSLKNYYYKWGQGQRSNKLEAGIFHGDLAIEVLKVAKRGLKLASFCFPNSQLTALTAAASLALRTGKAAKSIREGHPLELASHLLAIGALLIKLRAKTPSIQALDKAMIALGSGIELWLVLNK